MKLQCIHMLLMLWPLHNGWSHLYKKIVRVSMSTQRHLALLISCLQLQVLQSGPDTSSCSAFCCIILLLTRSLPGCFTCFRPILPSEPAVTHLSQLMSALMRLICSLCYARPLKIKMFGHLKMKHTEMNTMSLYRRVIIWWYRWASVTSMEAFVLNMVQYLAPGRSLPSVLLCLVIPRK